MIHLFLFSKKSLAYQYGIGTYIHQLMNALKNEKNIKLNIVYLHSDQKHFTIKNLNNIREFYIPNISVKITLPTDQTNIYKQNCLYLLEPYIASNPKVIFLFNTLEKENLLDFLKKSHPHIKTVYVAHQRETFFTINEPYLNFLRKIDHIICLNTATFKYFTEKGIPLSGKRTIIANGKENGVRFSGEKKKTIRKKWQLSSTEKVFLFVGRVDLMKGIVLIIDAFKQIISRYPDCRLFIVGDGELNTYIPFAAPYFSKIIFTGKLAKEEVNELYEIADIGLLPSYDEQCSFVGIEMLMFGLVTIVSDIEGFEDMFTEGYNTFRKINLSGKSGRNEETIHQLCDIMGCVLKELPDLKKELESNARESYEKDYTLEKMKNSYIHYIEELYTE